METSVNAWKNSGLSKKAFCRDWDIPYQTFHYWCKRVETFQWIKEEYPKVTAKSPIGKARAYSLKREKELSLFLSDGRLEIDKQKIENEIRPIALGRKNFYVRWHT